MSTIFLKIRGQSGFAVSSNTGFDLNYTQDFALPTFSGVLYAGNNLSFIDNFNNTTVNLSAIFSDYSTKTDTVQWSQISGDSGTFGSPNGLATTFTTASVNNSDIVLRITITRTTRGGTIQVFDDLALTTDQVQTLSSTTIRLDHNINTDNLFYNPSWVGSDNQTPEGDTDVIFWNNPESKGSYSYVGYKVQSFNKLFGQWYDVQTGGTQSNEFSYKITDDTLIYRYLPIWKSTYGKKVIGNSTPILKAKISGSNAISFGLFESIKPSTSQLISTSSSSVNRVAVSIGSISELDTTNLNTTQTAVISNFTADRFLNTLVTESEIDNLSNKSIRQSSIAHSLGVTRTSGVSLGEIGN